MKLNRLNFFLCKKIQRRITFVTSIIRTLSKGELDIKDSGDRSDTKVFFFEIQAAQEKIVKQLQHQLNEIQGKLEEVNRTLNDFDAAKKLSASAPLCSASSATWSTIWTTSASRLRRRLRGRLFCSVSSARLNCQGATVAHQV